MKRQYKRFLIRSCKDLEKVESLVSKGWTITYTSFNEIMVEKKGRKYLIKSEAI